ncbi:hypothetical protein [Jatrophihabitans sp.]|uniref:hypothetical protein n=1 Tax=Jatrophihabitans sp. TaxID=1932789 RepID=UPI002C73578B|nr:hypothetical protein [Jatrophihabitans sp.]
MSLPPWHLHSNDRSSEERSFEALLGRAPLPPDALATDAFLADIVDALTAPAVSDELAGLTRVRAAYTTLYAARQRRGGTYRRRSSMRSPLSHPKIATALAAGVFGLGGFGAAAYAGALPDAAQQVVHHVIGAPDSHPGKGAGHAPQPAGAPSSTPAGPDATGAAAFGLCNAYAHADDMAADKSVAFANLAAAAGGADQIEAYCATIPHPGSATASHPAGPPSTVPSDHPTGKPTALPSHPVGPPSTVPTDHPTGKPTAPPSHPVAPPSAVPSHSHPTGKPSTVPPSPSGHPTGH